MSNQYQQNNNHILRTNTVNNQTGQIFFQKRLFNVKNQDNIIQNNIINNPINAYQFLNNNYDNHQKIVQHQALNIQNYNEGKIQQNNLEISGQKIISQNTEGIEQNNAQILFKNNIHIGQLNLANSEQIFNLNNHGMKKNIIFTNNENKNLNNNYIINIQNNSNETLKILRQNNVINEQQMSQFVDKNIPINNNNIIQNSINNNNIIQNFSINNNNDNKVKENFNFINNNNNLPFNNVYSFSRYTKAPKTGLINEGDSSYLNAVLQILGGPRNIVSFFVNPKNIKYIRENKNLFPLSFAFQRLYSHLYPYPEKNEREIYKTESILKAIAKINKIYDTKKRRDPNELISFILNNLHQELNSNKNNNKLFNINKYDRNNVINNSIKKFTNGNNSVLFNLLNWFELKEIKCFTCHISSYYLYSYNTFELDILGTYNYKKKPITINDCLKYHAFQKKHNLYCNKCKILSEVLIQSNIYSAPNTFIFSLNRNNLAPNVMKIPFNICAQLNLSKYIENKISPANYQLIGILSFFVDKQKYMSFCLSPVDGLWYVYNEEIVEQRNINSILNAHNFCCSALIPCILVYKSVINNA